MRNIKERALAVGLLLAILLALPAAASPAPAGWEPPGAQVILVHQDQNGRQISAKVGDTLQVELPGSGGTGYSWYIGSLDSEHLQLLAEETRKISPERLVGGPVMYVWRFRVLRPGKTEIKIEYYRKWEGASQAADHFRLPLDLTPAR